MFTNQTFSAALCALKDKCIVFRKGWNGKGLFVYFVPPAAYKAQTDVAKQWFGREAMVPYAGYFALKNGDGQVHTWVPSVSDLLAEDWSIIEPDDEKGLLRLKGTKPVTINSIGKLAKKIRKEKDCTVMQSLNEAAARGGFKDYAAAQRELGATNGDA